MKPGVYYFKKDGRMVETAWLSEDKKIVTVWTWHCIKTGRGFLTEIPVESFKRKFKRLGSI